MNREQGNCRVSIRICQFSIFEGDIILIILNPHTNSDQKAVSRNYFPKMDSSVYTVNSGLVTFCPSIITSRTGLMAYTFLSM